MSFPESSDENRGNRDINTGGGAYVEGQVDTGGGDFVGRDQTKIGPSALEIKKIFEPIYEKIETKTQILPEDKVDLKSDVQDIEVEVAKGDNVDESFLARRFRNISRIAPDILDVVLATLTSPSAGFAMTVAKIAEKAKSGKDS